MLVHKEVRIGLLFIAAGISAQAQPGGCNTRLDSPSVNIMLPGNPFGVLPSADECWVFASVGGARGGIAVLKRQAGISSWCEWCPSHPLRRALL